MEKVFSTTYIRTDEDGRPDLESYHGKIVPGQPLAPYHNDTVLLSGGFPMLSPDSRFPLSPTLQLQSNLTSLRHEELLSVAEAELQRYQSIRYRSYRRDADPRVCVIATTAAELDDFIDTYGGVLEIHPLLLGGSCPRYPAVTELEIEEAKPHYRIRYGKRSPFNNELCTYCGACAACPQKCISPHLHLDYDQCTFCKECEKMCPVDAIDIGGVEEIVLHAPAILLLGTAEPDLPEKKSRIYRENQLQEYFKTLFSTEIKEVVCHNNNICQYSGRLGIGCGRCVDSCFHKALSRHETGIVVDHALCRECGSCIAACPTGAMQNGSFNDESLMRYLGMLRIGKGRDLVIGGEQELHLLWWRNGAGQIENTFYLEYPTLHALSFFHLLLFFSSGFSRVILLQDSESLRNEVEKANAVVSSLFDRAEFACCTRPADYDAAFHDIVFPHPLENFLEPAIFENRRALLSRIFLHLIRESGRELDTGRISADFPSISCDAAGCTQCLACLNECRTGALRADEESLALIYTAGLCVGCGVCVQVCPEKVLALADGSSVKERFFKGDVLAQAEPAVCRKCGKVFGSRKSLDRVLQILSSSETVNTDHFEYCGTCRAVNLFQAEYA
jgi:ferredoxin